MTLFMLYASFVAGLLGLAASRLDHALRARGLPTRWAWLGSLGASVGFGAWAFLRPPPPAVPDPSGWMGAPVAYLTDLGSLAAASAPSLERADGIAATLWLLGSGLLALALDLGAVAFHPFLLVPTGRGKGLEQEELPPEEYERILRWICQKQVEMGDRIFLKPTDAPHFMRIRNQYQRECGVSIPAPRHGHPGGHPGGIGMARSMLSLKGLKQVLKGHPGSMGMMTRGCLAGTGFCFISHVGQIQGCGYLDISAGSLKTQSFKEMWEGSSLFQNIRDLSLLKGKCGQCEYKKICGGCRARAFETTGDYLEEEPYCIYQPRKRKAEHGAVPA